MANNRIVHFEIPANQPEALTQFYGELFGWKFQQAPIPGVEYWLCETGSDGRESTAPSCSGRTRSSSG
jgi:uncharacterized protein